MAGIHWAARCQLCRRSARSGQCPTARPAAYAAPSDTVSLAIGRTTGTSSTSAMNCMSRLSAVIPPSTLSVVRARPESAFIASTTSRVCQAVASSTARARCPLVMYEVSPTTTPRASLRQCGAYRPEKAGTM